MRRWVLYGSRRLGSWSRSELIQKSTWKPSAASQVTKNMSHAYQPPIKPGCSGRCRLTVLLHAPSRDMYGNRQAPPTGLYAAYVFASIVSRIPPRGCRERTTNKISRSPWPVGNTAKYTPLHAAPVARDCKCCSYLPAEAVSVASFRYRLQVATKPSNRLNQLARRSFMEDVDVVVRPGVGNVQRQLVSLPNAHVTCIATLIFFPVLMRVFLVELEDVFAFHCPNRMRASSSSSNWLPPRLPSDDASTSSLS